MTKMRTVDAAVAILEKEGAIEAFGLPGAATNPFYEYWPSGGPEVVRVSAVVGIPIGVGERQCRCG